MSNRMVESIVSRPGVFRILFLLIVTIAVVGYLSSIIIARNAANELLFDKTCLPEKTVIAQEILEFYRPKCLSPWIERDRPQIQKEFQTLLRMDTFHEDEQDNPRRGGQKQESSINLNDLREAVKNKKSIAVESPRVPLIHHFPHFSEKYTFFFSVLIWQQDVFSTINLGNNQKNKDESSSSEIKQSEASQNTYIKTLSVDENARRFWNVDLATHSWMAALVGSVERHFGFKTIQSSACDKTYTVETTTNDHKKTSSKRTLSSKKIVSSAVTEQNYWFLHPTDSYLLTHQILGTDPCELHSKGADMLQGDVNILILNRKRDRMLVNNEEVVRSIVENVQINGKNVVISDFTAPAVQAEDSSISSVARKLIVNSPTLRNLRHRRAHVRRGGSAGAAPKNESIYHNINSISDNAKSDETSVVNSITKHRMGSGNKNKNNNHHSTNNLHDNADNSNNNNKVDTQAQASNTNSHIVGKYFEGVSFQQQVAIMYKTDVLISVHGAGEVNMAWMKPCSIVIELFPHHFYCPKSFDGLTNSKDLLYYSIQEEKNRTIHINNYKLKPECRKIMNDLDKFEEKYLNQLSQSNRINIVNSIVTKESPTKLIGKGYSANSERHITSNMEINDKCFSNGPCRSCSRGADGVIANIDKLRDVLTMALRDRQTCIANNLLYSPNNK